MLRAHVVAHVGERVTFQWGEGVGRAGDQPQFAISVRDLTDYPIGQQVVVVPVPEDWQDRVLVRWLKRKLELPA